jgi:hypothetical protein
LSSERGSLDFNSEDHPTESNIKFDPFIEQMSYDDISITATKNNQLKMVFSFDTNS